MVFGCLGERGRQAQAMPRMARIVMPDVPHHITQRGNRRLPTFFSDADYEAYLALVAEHCAACGQEAVS